MSRDASDPIDWDVAGVVAFLCNPREAPWADSTTAPRPDLTVLEAALRDNEVTGEVLLNDVDSQALKDDFGIKPLGHRSSVLRAINWLQARSPKYRARHGLPLPRETYLQGALSLSTASPSILSPTPTAPLALPLSLALSLPPSAVPTTTPPSPVIKEKRRIAPTLVADTQGLGILGQHQVPPASLVPKSGNGDHSVSPHAPLAMPPTPHMEENPRISESPFPLPPQPSSTMEKDFFDHLLEKYKDDGEVEPLYGDSESELDTESLAELEEREGDGEESEGPAGQKHVDQRTLSQEECEAVFSAFIDEYSVCWEREHRPKHQRHAHYVWNLGRDERGGAAYCADAKKMQQRLAVRLQSMKNMLIEAGYSTPHDLRDGCRVMEPTLDEVCLQKEPRQRKRREVDADEETLSSSSAVSSDSDWIVSDDEVESSGHVAEDDSSEGDDIDHRAPFRAFGRAQSPSAQSTATSDESERAFGVGKRLRITVRDRIHDSARIPEADDPSHQAGQHRPVPDVMCLESSSPSETSNHADRMDADTSDSSQKLPAGSPGQDVVNEDNGFMVTTPPLNPSTSSSLIPGLTLTPGELSFIHESASSGPLRDPSRRASTGSAQTQPPLDIQDIDLFHLVSEIGCKQIDATGNSEWILAKQMTLLAADEREPLGEYLERYVDNLYVTQVDSALSALLQDQPHFDGMTSEESATGMRLAIYYVCWHCRTSPGLYGVQKDQLKKALEDLDLPTFLPFFRRLKGLFEAYAIWVTQPTTPGLADHKRAEPSTLSTTRGLADHQYAESNSLKRKRRRRGTGRLKPLGSRPLSTMQKDAQMRQAEQELGWRRLRQELESRGVSNSDPNKQAVTFKDPVIYLDPHLGRFVKPHQLTGIQFMWRELIEAGNPQGCLLAHVMGLGKTFQVVSLLSTIAAAAASEDPRIRDQVPQRFHNSRTLILCPSSLVQNWIDEFRMWLPRGHRLGVVYEVSRRLMRRDALISDRVGTIAEWSKNGGVLVISYELFRNSVTNKPPLLTQADHQLLKVSLLSKASIVVADEAHRLKSANAAISQLVSQFHTLSRIALTGSPLSNQLSEYYQMVDWVAPGYLEDAATFKKKFMDPIQAGSYIDSTMMEQRESLVALQLLNGILAPKVLRADTAVLANDLPPKTEFIITVPLTQLQKDAYNLFVDCARSDVANSTTKLWSWLAIMQLCCNHPLPFYEKLAGRVRENAEIGEVQSILPNTLQEAELPSDLVSLMDELLRSYSNKADVSLSHRAVLLDKILDLCAEAGDKVLVFTQSIPTLNFLDNMFKDRGRSFRRIDGSVTGLDRQTIVKEFNRENDEEPHILLISTRAGGVGLNMHSANRVVIFDFLFNPMWEEQAVGRAYRIGQRKPVFVYRFVSGGTFEQLIFNNAVFKRQLAVRVVDKKTVVRESSRKVSTYLTHVHNVVRDDQHEALGWDSQVLDKLLHSEYREIVLQAKLSHIRDNESDHLTTEEKRQVEDELAMERLKRSDPAAFQAEMKKRELQERLAGTTNSLVDRRRLSQPHMTPFIHARPHLQIGPSRTLSGQPALPSMAGANGEEVTRNLSREYPSPHLPSPARVPSVQSALSSDRQLAYLVPAGSEVIVIDDDDASPSSVPPAPDATLRLHPRVQSEGSGQPSSALVSDDSRPRVLPGPANSSPSNRQLVRARPAQTEPEQQANVSYPPKPVLGFFRNPIWAPRGHTVPSASHAESPTAQENGSATQEGQGSTVSTSAAPEAQTPRRVVPFDPPTGFDMNAFMRLSDDDRSPS
ncbi:hypothetical protein N7539_000521 [Penicillium diatomitis]|uniref:Uncharacterized protein n=1 Tax=Penicillium diatomitis TaxID=2819901 RepID=A0A9W9XMQ6_9EURO|nr:uncharacterized protein N7539_000521 [Penicillium diatomitis]KAJ5495405.1 hypothetical protein N7539_000521 [Penicillium diatomitis]